MKRQLTNKKIVEKLFISVLFLTTSIYSQDSEVSETRRGLPDIRTTQLLEVFPKFDIASDSALSLLPIESKDVSPYVRNLLIYKIKIRWPFKEELRFAEIQFLTTYFEKKIKTAFAREKRFAFVSAQDLKAVMVRATDSSVQVRNVLTGDDLKKYGKTKKIDGVVTCDVMITPNQLIFYIDINDLDGITLWSKEYKAIYRVLPYDYGEDIAAQQHIMRSKTGYIENYLTVSFQGGTLAIGDSSAGESTGLISVGYRFNEVATIIDFVKFHIDSRIVANTSNFYGLLLQPGFSFDLYSTDQLGSGIILLDVGGGFDVSFKNNLRSVFNLGVTFRMSKNLGFTGYLHYIPTNVANEKWDLGGVNIGAQVNFVL
ncbi:MAG: hypothetical protein O3A55_01915 [Bacteroidetes bacterium]|nr:hypothetical protein [Bacteroidota bacterium]